MEQPLRRPTATVRRVLGWGQVLLAVAVVLGAVLVGQLVQRGIDAGAAEPPTHAGAALPETALPEAPRAADTEVTAGGTVADGGPAALGTLILGWTLVAAAGTVARRGLDDRESARWAWDWARVEPVWSGRVTEASSPSGRPPPRCRRRRRPR